LKILFLTRYGRLGPSSRMRILQFLPWLEQGGIECVLAPPLVEDHILRDRYKKGVYLRVPLLRAYWRRVRTLMVRRNYDLLWIEKEALPWVPAWIERWLLRGVPYVLDYDDAIFHNYDLHSSFLIRQFFGRRVDRVMAGARLIVAGNEYLAQRAQDAGAPWVEVLPTVIDLNRYEVRPTSTYQSGPFQIVWIGSPSTAHYLSFLREPLYRLSRQFSFRLRVIGADLPVMPGVVTESIRWSEESDAASIRTGDVGVMPLNNSPWEQGKCGFKLIQYMATGIPVVASPVGVNRTIVEHGTNGFLASTQDEWVNALQKLKDDPLLRIRMGAAGRKKVEQKYCIQVTAPRLISLFHKILAS
jgi:glycosyltransferase involved in cell wall biosynthesis